MDVQGTDTIEGTSAGRIARGTAIGRYTILWPVGRGAMGEVYAAFDPQLDRKVALKLLLPSDEGSSAESSRGSARLLREAKALAMVSHPNVVAVHDAGTFGAHVFVAMEFVDGSTLGDWLAERPRTREEILAVFVEAARGLTAAHDAGLVHRDFKPGNVMIGSDGAVRVTDFGLARPLGTAVTGADTGAPAAGAVDLRLTLTATGQMLGTPLYMAPEQFKAEPTDARTDQFSFCVALYAALYGAPPFGGGDLMALMSAVLAGRVQAAPPRSTVPAWLRRVLLRGLSVDPGARWPSMRALVAALKPEGARTRTRWGLTAVVVALAAVPVFMLARHDQRSAALCRSGPARLIDVWELDASATTGRRQQISRAFLASGAPGARDVWDRTATLLDSYAKRWLAAYADACEATHVRGEQSTNILDLRMGCVEERRTALAALTSALAHADRDVVGKAVDAANALPELSRCADVKQLAARTDPPRDEATRVRVAELRRQIASAKVLYDTGKYREGLADQERLTAEARALGYRPLLAETLGVSDFVPSVEGPEVEKRLDDTIWTSIEVGRDDIAAKAAIARITTAYFFSPDLSGATYWIGLSQALLDRAGPGHEHLRSWFLHNQALLKERAHDLPAALALMREAVALKERILPKGHPDIATSLNGEANFLTAIGDKEGALQLVDRAHEAFVAAYGRASVESAYTLSNRGEYLMDLHRPSEALPALREGLSLWEAHSGPDHPNLAFPLTSLGRALVALGRPKEAVPVLERALRLRDPKGTPPELVGETQFALAQALAGAGAGEARTRTMATGAKEAFGRAANAARVEAVDAWLAAR